MKRRVTQGAKEGLYLGTPLHARGNIPKTLDGDRRAGKKWSLIAKVETGFDLRNFLLNSRLWNAAIRPPEGSPLF
jgi:hypothetical protein